MSKPQVIARQFKFMLSAESKLGHLSRLCIRYNMVYTVDYTSVTSIIHCRHVVSFLFNDCYKLRVRSVAAKKIGVGKMLSTCGRSLEYYDSESV